MKSEDEYDSNEKYTDEQAAEIFKTNFLNGCSSFVYLAMVIKGCKEQNSSKVIQKMIDDIIGNRNKETIQFADYIQPLYAKVLEYCKDVIDKQTQYEYLEFDQEVEKLKLEEKANKLKPMKLGKTKRKMPKKKDSNNEQKEH